MSSPSTGPGSVDSALATLGWWLVDDDDRVAGGPFPSQVDAAVAELAVAAAGPVRALYGLRMDDDTVLTRFSPEDQTWLTHLSDQLNRLADEWDLLISDADPLTGLVCEVAAAVVESGLSLHDCTGRTPSRPLGGVCLTPSPAQAGVLVSWAQHDRMAVHRIRGSAAERAAQRTMSAAVADVLDAYGFVVSRFEGTTAFLVQAGAETDLSI
ncbi:hypothetical protein [Modestobacter sp. NPDC049651]|uniref:hypothetical protein n=1 Tax=unclassified Modestobacter TaxID=2643866 RepID=UPI0033DA8FD5